jgi:hypothetical protein
MRNKLNKLRIPRLTLAASECSNIVDDFYNKEIEAKAELLLGVSRVFTEITK